MSSLKFSPHPWEAADMAKKMSLPSSGPETCFSYYHLVSHWSMSHVNAFHLTVAHIGLVTYLCQGWHTNYGEFLFYLPQQSCAFEVETPYVLVFMALAISFLSPITWIHVHVRNMISFPFGTCLLFCSCLEVNIFPLQ